jgi:hypothetical protein
LATAIVDKPVWQIALVVLSAFLSGAVAYEYAKFCARPSIDPSNGSSAPDAVDDEHPPPTVPGVHIDQSQHFRQQYITIRSPLAVGTTKRSF